MISFDQIYDSIHSLIPHSIIEVEDLTGTGDHLSITVTSSTFIGLSRVKQHQLIYRALKNELASEEIHSIVLDTLTPY